MDVRLADMANGLRIAAATAAIAALASFSSTGARAQAAYNCTNLPPDISVNSGTPSLFDTVSIDLLTGQVLIVRVTGNADDSRSEITNPSASTTIILPGGTPGPRTGSFTVQQDGIHSLLRDLFIVSPNTATMTLQCSGPGGGGPPGSSTFDELFLNAAINNHRSRFDAVPNGGDFLPSIPQAQFDPIDANGDGQPGIDPLTGERIFLGPNRPQLRISDNNFPLPRDRVFPQYNYFNNVPVGSADFDGDGFQDVLQNYGATYDLGASVDPRQGIGPLGTGPVQDFGRPMDFFRAPQSDLYDLSITSDQILRQLDYRRRNAEAMALAGIEGAAAVDAYIPPPGLPQPAPLWHFWLDGSIGESERGGGLAAIDTDLGELTAGVYHSSFRTGASTGGYLNFRSADSDAAGGFSLDSEAFGVALFHIAPLGHGFLGKLLVFFEAGDADAAQGAVTGSFDFTTWQIEGEVTGHHDFGHWWVRPRANLFYALTDRDGFIASDGTPVAGGETDTLRLTFGPRIGHRLWAGDHFGWVAPYLGLEGEWDIVDEGDAISPTGAIYNADPFNFRLSGGINATVGGVATTTLEASVYGAGGGDDEGHELKGTVNIPLN